MKTVRTMPYYPTNSDHRDFLAIRDFNNKLQFQNYLIWLREKKHHKENTFLNNKLDHITNKLTDLENHQKENNRLLYLLIRLGSVLIILSIIRIIKR